MQEKRRSRWEVAKQKWFPAMHPCCKWMERHEPWIQRKEVLEIEGKPGLKELLPDKFYLHLARKRDAWDEPLKTGHCPHNTTADMSQSLGRIPLRSDGRLPTITPGAHILMAEAGRALAPMEKLLMHALPLHKMTIPSNVSDSELEDMAGNMMHLQFADSGFAMLMAISLVDWMSLTTPQPSELSAVLLNNSRLAAALQSRYGMDIAKFKERRKATKFKANRKPKHIACLRGTRWAS